MVSVSWNVFDNMINVLTDSGRCTRPLLLCEALKSMPKNPSSWEELCVTAKPRGSKIPSVEAMRKSVAVMEFIDVEESNTCMIAIDIASIEPGRHTHCEIHPSTMFSVYSATIPLPNHNAAPRNVFSGAQGKQAIGVYATNYNRRIDTLGLILHYPQRSLVSTRYMEYLNVNKLPNGENLIVAIMSYSGYNQEDSIIVNRDSVKKGMFNLTYYTTHVANEWKNESAECRFANPEDLSDLKFADYTKINQHGFPIVGSKIEQGDCIVGKIIKTTNETVIGDVKTDFWVEKKTRQEIRSDCDIADKTTYGIVNQVAVFENGDTDCRGVKVQLRQVREPELGDKMASRHGQKGVIGAIIPSHEMPFTKDGLVPDIIINPHAFPSRMTIGHLIECIMAKAGAVGGFYANGTAFENQNVSEMAGSVLAANGYESNGDEIMYNGMTGEQIACNIFIGPTYYFRLKHMVADKINFRADGKVVGLTQQPTKGRGNDGGLRMGEMETNAVLAHGISSFIKESMMERSDKYTLDVDGLTGSKDDWGKKVQVPFSFKLLSQEMMTMSVEPIFVLDKDSNSDKYNDDDSEPDSNYDSDNDNVERNNNCSKKL